MARFLYNVLTAYQLPMVAFMGLFILIGYSSRLRERRDIAQSFRERDHLKRIADLQHAWRVGFRRHADESEDEFVNRFRAWIRTGCARATSS
jgi:hypothetical protein